MLLAAVMAVTLQSVPAFAEEQVQAEKEVFEGNTEEMYSEEEIEKKAPEKREAADARAGIASGKKGALTWQLDAQGVLTISGTGEMESLTDSEAWRSDELIGKIKKAVIKKGVTAIGGSAFEGCSNMTDITIPDSVTTIGNFAFGSCSSLMNITIPGKVTTIGGAVFRDCEKITKITIPNSVTAIYGDTFYGCSSLQSVSLPNSITMIGPYAFTDCSSLKSIIIPSGVTEIPLDAFSGCSNLESVTMPKGMKEIGVYAFNGCSKLNKITIPENVTVIGYSAFSGCSSLKSITIPGKVKEIGHDTFFGCTSLKNVKLSNSVAKIGAWAFLNCSSLERIMIPKSVTEIQEQVFTDCPLLKSIYFEGNPPAFSEVTFEGVTATAYYPSGNTAWTTGVMNNYSGNLTWKTYEPGSVNFDDENTSNTGTGTIVRKKIKVSKVKITGLSNKIAAGKKITLKAAVTPSNASNKKVTWKSSNTRVATVNQSGVVTLKKNSGGKTVTITATAKDGSGKKATYKITSMKGVVKKIAISGKTSVKAGKTLKLKAKVTASKKANKKIKWTSSNKKYASVSSSGTVKAYKAGKGKKVRITAAATDGSGKKKVVTIRIIK